MPTTYIIGHQKPDTDSVVSAMALEYLFSQADCFGHSNPKAAIIDELNPETKYLFEKFGVDVPPLISAKDIEMSDRVVLVDHNEESQRLEGLNPKQIVEIIDHHKANLNLTNSIFMNFKAWGSTAAIAYFMMQQYPPTPIDPGEKLAALMLAAVLSDTVGFKSSTTTEKDKEIGQKLAKIAGITDIDAFALEIFKAKSNISGLTDEEIVKNDPKVYEFAQKTFIGQIETVEQATILQTRKETLLRAMASVKEKEGVELLFLAITDVLQANTKLLILGDAEQTVAQKAFADATISNQIMDIGPKLSRKKEIAPAIEKALG